jgi:hypothetical protein
MMEAVTSIGQSLTGAAVCVRQQYCDRVGLEEECWSLEESCPGFSNVRNGDGTDDAGKNLWELYNPNPTRSICSLVHFDRIT